MNAKLLFTTISTVAYVITSTAVFATPKVNINSNNNNREQVNRSYNRNNNSNRNVNEVRNHNRNRNNSRSSSQSSSSSQSRSNSGAFSGSSSRTGDSFSTSGSDVNQSGELSNTLTPTFTSGNNSGNPNFSSQYETDDLYLTLPSVGSMQLPENTNPGVTASCPYFNFQASYTGGSSTGFRLYLLEFQNSNTPSELTGQDMFTLVGTCGVIEQLKSLKGYIDQDLLDSATELGLEKLLKGLYQLHGEEYNPRMLKLNTIGKTSSGVGENLDENN